jgi:hypothetical protein
MNNCHLYATGKTWAIARTTATAADDDEVEEGVVG